MTLDEINKLLRSELSAVETYKQALEKEQQKFGQEGELQRLNAILTEHQQAAAQLRTQIQQLGGTPIQDSGAWGVWSTIVMGRAKVLGDIAALKALKDGEETIVKEYQELLQDPTMPAEVKILATNIISKGQMRIQELNMLMTGPHGGGGGGIKGR
jgi:hypothetical protein